MNTYFFDIADGAGLYADTAGTQLRDIGAARIEAISILQDLARDEMGDGADKLFIATARNAAGQLVFRATLTLTGEWLPN